MSNEALEFLRSKRAANTEEETNGAPNASEDDQADVDPLETEETAEGQDFEEVEVESDTEEAEAESDEESYYQIDDEEITLDQIREWKRGYLRESDYTQKTQAASEERKQLESDRSKFNEKYEHLGDVIGQLESLIQTEEESVDWDALIEEDPSQYLKLQKQQAKRRESLKDAKQQRESEASEAQKKHLEKQMDEVRRLIPKWLDANGDATDVMQKDVKSINSYLSTVGFSTKDINQVLDGKMWAVFKDAAQYHALKGKKPAVDNKLKKAPKVIKPSKGTRKAPKAAPNDEIRKRFKQSGSERDAMAFLKSRRS